jgi:L-asparaginase
VRDVTILAAGGTIASVGGIGGRSEASVALTPKDLIASVPKVAVMPGLRARSVRSMPSPHLTLQDAFAVAQAARAETEIGRGVVVTSGTDTLEELAVLCDSMCGNGAPVVLTGAIRPASAPGADGPANLADSVAAAAADVTRGLGAVVCFAGELHAGRSVRKVDSTSPHAFGSPRGGPLGRVVEGRIELMARPVRHPTIAVEHLNFDVTIASTWLGDDGALLRAALGLRPDGLVLATLGGGHLSPHALAALREAPPGLPVVASVRPSSGAFLRSTYGYEGSEGDLLAAGVIPAGGIAASAARMLLLAGLGAGLDRPGLSRLFSVGA